MIKFLPRFLSSYRTLLVNLLKSTVLGPAHSLIFLSCASVLSACQGFNERIPSSAIFELKAKEESNLQSLNLDSSKTHTKLNSNNQVNKNLNRSLKVKQSFALKLDKRSESNLNLSQNVNFVCKWARALKNSNQEMLPSIKFEIIQSQSQLWVETSLPPQFKKALDSAYNHLPLYSHLGDQGGLWVIYRPLNGTQQSLLLAKPIPWMHDRAKVIAHCKPDKMLTELTFIPLNLEKSFPPNQKLSLVSQELQVHSTSDKE